VSPSLKKIDDRFAAVVFLDIGAGGVLKSLPGQPSSYFLAGVGPGLRYDISSVLRTRFDVGFRLTDVPFASSTKGEGQFYFSVIASY
jgi:hemolysin activation/secretion protein